MEELNRQGKEFVNKWCNEVHGTTKRIPNQHYLLEEQGVLLPLPKTRYRIKNLQSRIISPDSFISINGSKYSVPVKYVGKTLLFRITYGFRIEIYDRKENPVLRLEAEDKKGTVKVDNTHYAAIATPISTSIPQIRRDFTKRFSNGQRYLEAAGRKFNQPTHYARKIMLLGELYDDTLLDRFIGYSIEQDQMDITSFKKILRSYNTGELELPDNKRPGSSTSGQIIYRDDDPALTRDCSYYEENTMTEVYG